MWRFAHDDLFVYNYHDLCKGEFTAINLWLLNEKSSMIMSWECNICVEFELL